MKVKDELAHLKSYIQSHKGMNALHQFGENLLKAPLEAVEFKIFMATLWAFYKETPSGILNLALRICDFWRNINPWEANAKAAHILYAGFDEFGIQSGEAIVFTHHQLFKLSSLFFGVAEHDLNSNDYILEAGTEMGKNSRIGYREKSLAFGLGFHLASELTSWLEFKYFYEGILKHKHAYKIESENSSAMKFFDVHTLVEIGHVAQSEAIVHAFSQIIHAGAYFYMDSYDGLFTSLNVNIY